MKKYSIFFIIPAFLFVSCTKQVAAPASSAASGPQLTFKSYSITTIGDSIRNVTALLPFTYPTTAYINYLDPRVVAMQCQVNWFTISESGEQVEMGATAQVDANLATYMIQYKTYQCVLLQFQNKETDHYTDGSLREILVGDEYYKIVGVQ